MDRVSRASRRALGRTELMRYLILGGILLALSIQPAAASDLASPVSLSVDNIGCQSAPHPGGLGTSFALCRDEQDGVDFWIHGAGPDLWLEVVPHAP